MKMRIFSKKALEFHHPKDYGTSHKVEMQNFAVVPDWVADSAMFKHAEKDGDVQVIESRQDEIKAETGGTTEPASAAGKGKGKSGGDAGATGDNNGTPPTE